MLCKIRFWTERLNSQTSCDIHTQRYQNGVTVFLKKPFFSCLRFHKIFMDHLPPIQRYFGNKQMHKIQITNLLQFFSPHWLRSSRHFQHTWLLFNFFRQVMQPHLNDTLKRPLTCFLHSFWNMFQPFDLQGKCLYFNLSPF